MPLPNQHITAPLIQFRIGRHRRAFGAMDNTLDILNTSNGKLLYKLQPGLGVTKAQAHGALTPWLLETSSHWKRRLYEYVLQPATQNYSLSVSAGFLS